MLDPRLPGAAYAVLAYHQVEEAEDDLRQAISAQRFSEQLAYLRRHGEILPLTELLARWRRGVAPQRWTFALTFDDGYANLARVAHPLLAASSTPATVFLTTGFIDQREALPWWDRLRHFLATPSATARWDGSDHPLATRAQRAAFGKHVSRTIVHDYRRLSELEALLAARAADSAPGDNEFLDWDTLRTLTRAGIFDFAPHTVWHPVLSTAADYADEITRSHTRLRDELGITSTLFAYPYGRPQHYSARVQEALKILGVESAFTTVYGHLEPRSPPLALPRINVGRHDSLAKFAMRLRRPWLFEWGYKWREFKYRSRP